ncbi:MAG: DUF87 domain-containing protein [Anaerolineae bacterium]
MISSLSEHIAKLASVDMFKRNDHSEPATGLFVGRPFYLDYDHAYLLVADAWKEKAKGLPQGAFLLAYYMNEDTVSEALLLRVLQPTKLPTDNDVISSMIEYYKDNLRTAGRQSQLDDFTRYEFSFSGLECRILGTFYKDKDARTRFGADVENFYSAHNYSVVKPNLDVLETIVNFREGDVVGKPTDIRIGGVRYSSSRRFQELETSVPVFVSPQDFLGKRTALFGMTRTGKSNTVKKIIQATVEMSNKAPQKLDSSNSGNPAANLDPFNNDLLPKYPVGQIIFDINGEYANANLQDAGTAIFDLYKDRTIRYSTINKPGFKVMKVNFYNDIEAGFELICSGLGTENSDYVKSFRSMDLSSPEDQGDFSAATRHARKLAAYRCCLYRAGFAVPSNFKVTFQGEKELNKLVRSDGSLDPSKGISLKDATDWFTAIWDKYDDDYFTKYKQEKGHEWADEDLKAILIFLTRRSKPRGAASVSGYLKLRALKDLHTDTLGKSFQDEILEEVRRGHIIIVDLSQGDPSIQALYSERICRQIFQNAMQRFISNMPNNFIQFYFEEAHNLFPKKDDRDLSQIYNRIAKGSRQVRSVKGSGVS